MEIKIVKGEYLDANVYVLSQGGKALIIDAGAKLEKVKKVVGNDNVLAVLLTHGHFDHCLYALDYAKEFSCPIYLHKRGKKIASDPESNYSEDGFYIHDFSAFKFISGDGKLSFPEFDIAFFSTPGHSPGGVCYLTRDKLFAGDTLFENGIGRIDLIGSDKNEMIESLEKLNALDFDEVYSGHGEKSDKTRQKRNIALHIRFLKR